MSEESWQEADIKLYHGEFKENIDGIKHKYKFF